MKPRSYEASGFHFVPDIYAVSFLIYKSMGKTISKHDGGNTPINHIDRI